ncbi:MAG: hypothetical protein ABW136_04370, partial [Steroidobacteraceae bacterium]
MPNRLISFVSAVLIGGSALAQTPAATAPAPTKAGTSAPTKPAAAAADPRDVIARKIDGLKAEDV